MVREFDLQTGKFVAGGFEVPLSKNSADWIDQDRLLVGRAVEGSQTKSGYPVKLVEWKRGTPLDSAPVVATGEANDIGMSADQIGNAEARYPMIFRTISYFDSRRRCGGRTAAGSSFRCRSMPTSWGWSAIRSCFVWTRR